MKKPLYSGSYRTTPEMLSDAYKTYMGSVNDVRKTVLMIIFFILGVCCVLYAIFHNENRYGVCFAAAVCFGCFAISWYNPRKRRREVTSLFKEIAGDLYNCNVYDDKIIISTTELAPHNEEVDDERIENAKKSGDYGIPPTIIPYDDKYLTVIEKPEYFIIGNQKSFYVAPKKGFENPKELADFLKSKVEKYTAGE